MKRLLDDLGWIAALALAVLLVATLILFGAIIDKREEAAESDRVAGSIYRAERLKLYRESNVKDSIQVLHLEEIDRLKDKIKLLESR